MGCISYICRQGRMPCPHPDACAAMHPHRAECRRQLRAEPELLRSRAADTTPAQAEGARMCGSWPYLGMPTTPGGLTEAELDRHIAERSPAPRMPRAARVMPAIVACTVTPPPSRLRLALRRAWRAVVRFVFAPRAAL